MEEKTQAEEIEEQLAAKAKAEKAPAGAPSDTAEGTREGKESTEEVKEAPIEDKRKSIRKERTGILYINATSNNTILSLTDMAGNTIARSSGGQSTKQSRLKSSPTVAMFAAKKIGEEAKDANISNLYVRTKGRTGSTTTGSAPFAIIKSLGRDGFKIISIMEITKHPRGGPKQKGGRRGRRV